MTERYVNKVSGLVADEFVDELSVEEPLEIRVNGRAVAVTMRTPGASKEEDRELAVGFLFTEGIVARAEQIKGAEIVKGKNNITDVILTENVQVDPALFERHSYIASSCGVCGKKSIDAVRIKRQYKCAQSKILVSPEVIHRLPARLREAQKSFASTGGIHATGLFDLDGNLLAMREDVGRHNAMDKVLGRQFLDGKLPLADNILLVSGRASFELVQKAAHAGVGILAAVGAPSSLAVQLAEETSMTLLGFVREERFNIYCGAQRIILKTKEEVLS